MALFLKLVFFLAMPICVTLALLGRAGPTSESPKAEIAAAEESSAPPSDDEVVEVIDLSRHVLGYAPLHHADFPDGDPVPARDSTAETPTGLGKLWKSFRSGFDWGQAAIDR
jgi:hypothetical protein